MSDTLTPDAGPRPALRGWAHAISFPLWLVLGVTMITTADTGALGTALLAVYVGGTATMFGVSALYHRGRWRPRVKAILQRCDRSAIFLAIAGGYTPIAWASLSGVTRTAVLVSVWGGAAIGIAIHWLPRAHRAVRGGSYMVVSWVAIAVFPQLHRAVGPSGFWLILVGGICYTIGAIAFATRWPNPWPRVFGFHEVFHAFTVVAAALQFIAVAVGVVPLL